MFSVDPRLLERDPWPVLDVVAWLASEGRFEPHMQGFVTAFAERLRAAGAPIARIYVAGRTLHPQVMARTVEWLHGGKVQVTDVPHVFANIPEFVGSPLDIALTTNKPYRRRLTQLDPVVEHDILLEVADRGATDYVAVPLRYADGLPGSVMVFDTERAGGFDDDDISAFGLLADFVAPVMEALMGAHVARSLLDTYLGRRTGERVLRGQIQRGEGERIRAAMWFSDLRESTRLSEELPLPELLGALNQYFELVSAAVTPHGGEILRFIGDAMLIVFTDEVGVDGTRACQSALDAVDDAYNGLDVVNHRRRAAGQPELSFGVGLHYGEVIYGNVGAPERLDFTVMGSAVNQTARLEGLTKSLGDQVLMSREFVDRVAVPTRSHGEHQMRGFVSPSSLAV